jgi:hypothetical protein
MRSHRDQARPTLLAYEMNHAALEPAHGFPLRVVVPGVIGARSVKWLERIIIRDHESDNFYQARDYKVLPPEATPETKADYLQKTPALHEFSLNSVICSPSDGETVEAESGNSAAIAVKGYRDRRRFATGPRLVRAAAASRPLARDPIQRSVQDSRARDNPARRSLDVGSSQRRDPHLRRDHGPRQALGLDVVLCRGSATRDGSPPRRAGRGRRSRRRARCICDGRLRPKAGIADAVELAWSRRGELERRQMPPQTPFIILSPRSRLTCLYSCRDAAPTRIALHPRLLKGWWKRHFTLPARLGSSLQGTRSGEGSVARPPRRSVRRWCLSDPRSASSQCRPRPASRPIRRGTCSRANTIAVSAGASRNQAVMGLTCNR